MDSPSPGLALPVATASLVVLASWLAWRFLESVFLRPYGIYRKLRGQGVPGYPFRPIVGQLPDLIKVYTEREQDPALAASTEASLFFRRGTEKFGPIWSFGFASINTVVVCDLDIVRQVWVAHSMKMHKQEFAKRMLEVVGTGILFSEGEQWQRQRRLLNPAFSLREIKRLYPVMAECADQACDQWQARVEASALAGAPPAPLPMDSELARLTLEVVSRAVFGMDIQAELGREGLHQFLKAFEEHFPLAARAGQIAIMFPVARYLPVEMNRKVWASRKVILGAVRKIVTSRVAQHKERLRRTALGEASSGGGGGGGGGGEGGEEAERVDLLNLMMSASDLDSDPLFAHGAPHGASSVPLGLGSGKKGVGKGAGAGAGAGEAPMTVQQLMDECLTFLGAGFETTGNLMTWTMLLLSQHPEWQERGRREALALCQAGKWAPSFEELSELKAIPCILNESLRLYPPGTGLGRSVSEDTRVSDTLVLPKGCDVFVPIQVVHRSKELWGADALEFRPERFADGISKAATQAGAFLPFSLGPRVCIGQSFAMAEAKVILGALLCRFTWTVADTYVHHPEALVTQRAKHGMPIILTPLEPSRRAQ